MQSRTMQKARGIVKKYRTVPEPVADALGHILPVTQNTNAVLKILDAKKPA